MAVRVTNVADDSLFEFTCAQWALMSAASQADWNVTENTCGIQTGYGNPYAATDLIFTLNGVLGAQAPITLTLIDGVYTVGISPASADGPGSMSVNDWLKAQAYLEPVSLNTISVAIPVGAVTSITVGTALLENEYVAGDVFSVVNNANGERVKLTVTASTTAGDTTIAVSGTAADEIPIGGILVPIFSVRQFLTSGSGITITSGAIINTAPDQVVALTSGANISITGTYPNFTISATGASYTNEEAQDAVGTILVDSSTIDFTYNDGTPSITADIIANSVGNTHIRQGVSRSVIGRSASTTGNVADIQSGGADLPLVTNGANTAISFAQLATGGIADDAVTYAKIQNVSATSRILGRVTAGAGNVEELTVAQVQTLLGYLDGSLTTPRIPYASDANTLIDSANLRWLNATKEVIVGNGASLNARFSHAETASIAGNSVFALGSNNVSGNYLSGLFNTRNLAGANAIQYIAVGGGTAGDPILQFIVNGAVTHAIGTDNSDADKFKITPNSATPGGNANSGLVITNALVSLVGINMDAPIHPLDVAGSARAVNLRNTLAAPTVGSLGNGLGTGATIDVVDGGNNGFFINFTTGTAPTANGTMFTVTYANPFTTYSHQVWQGYNANAVTDYLKFRRSATGPTSFTMAANGTLAATTTYNLGFIVIGQ